MSSNFLKLNTNDLVKGIVIAVLTALLVGLEQIMVPGSLPTLTQLKVVGISAVGAGLAYLVKNMFTNSQGQLLKGETSSPYQKDIPK